MPKRRWSAREWFAEFKRRRLFRVVAGYAVVIFGLLQVADVVVKALHLPEWTLTLLVVLAGLGMPMALVLGWVFDLTPRGVMRTAPLSEPAAAPEVAAAFPSRAIGRMVISAMMGAVLAIGAVGAYLYAQQREAASQGGAVKSLVVLPFVNASGNADAEYLSDGIAESLIDSLSQISGLRVIGRASAFRYKGKEIDLNKLGRDLSVDAVLTGRVQQRGDTLAIHADLVHVGNGSQLWGEGYNRKFEDLLVVQQDIAKAISRSLRPRLAAGEQNRVTRRYTESSEAYQSYLRGRYFANRLTVDGLARSVEYFQQAIEADPTYALAYSAMADSYALLIEWGNRPVKETCAKAELAANKALSLDGELAEAHASLGLIKIYTWEWLIAGKEYQRAIELNPNYARAHARSGVLLVSMGQFEEGLAEYRRALELEPTFANHASNLASDLCILGRYNRGIATAKDAIELDPQNPAAYWVLAGCYWRKKMYAESIAELWKALTLNSTNVRTLGALGYAYAVSGNRGDALRILEELKQQPENVDVAVLVAGLYAGLNDQERAFEWLEKAYQRRSIWLRRLKSDSQFDALRSDSRFTDLVRRVGLPP